MLLTQREEPFFLGYCVTRGELYATEKESKGKEKYGERQRARANKILNCKQKCLF